MKVLFWINNMVLNEVEIWIFDGKKMLIFKNLKQNIKNEINERMLFNLRNYWIRFEIIIKFEIIKLWNYLIIKFELFNN